MPGPEKYKAEIFAPIEHACTIGDSRTIIDGILVDAALAFSFEHVTFDQNARTPPRKPATMTLGSAAENIWVQRLKADQKIPATPPVGPQPEPPDYTDLNQEVRGLLEDVRHQSGQ
eukprot:4187565-Pyramimonas_sp.AAC.1